MALHLGGQLRPEGVTIVATNDYSLSRSLSLFGRSVSRCVIVWCSASLELHLDAAAMQSAVNTAGQSSVIDSSGTLSCGAPPSLLITPHRKRLKLSNATSLDSTVEGCSELFRQRCSLHSQALEGRYNLLHLGLGHA